MQKALRITKVDSNATVFRLPPEGSTAQVGPGKPLDPLGCYLHPWASPTEAVKATVPCLHAKVAMSKQLTIARTNIETLIYPGPWNDSVRHALPQDLYNVPQQSPLPFHAKVAMSEQLTCANDKIPPACLLASMLSPETCVTVSNRGCSLPSCQVCLE